MAALGALGVALRVAVKARCLFEVVSCVSGKLGDPHSTKVPSSKEVSDEMACLEGSLSQGSFYSFY